MPHLDVICQGTGLLRCVAPRSSSRCLRLCMLLIYPLVPQSLLASRALVHLCFVGDAVYAQGPPFWSRCGKGAFLPSGKRS